MKGRANIRGFTVVAFGETLWDLLPTGRVLGGAPFNFAYRVKSLGDRGMIITRVGTDTDGQKALQQMKALGMTTDFVQVDEKHPTGTVKVTLQPQQDPAYIILPEVAYDFITPTDEMLDVVARADCFCFGTLAQRSEQARETLRQVLSVVGGLKLLDINLRRECFSPATIEDSLERANILKMNLPEAHYLADLFEFSDPSLPAFCQEMAREWDLSHCIVTLGEHGALIATGKDEMIYEPGYRVDVVDTCGAGDAFSAGFINYHLRGKPLLDCLQFGNALGALVAAQSGATQPISQADVQKFLENPPERIVEPTLQKFAVS
jgi:fructokinase